VEFKKIRSRRVHQRIHRLKEILKVVEHLGGRTVQRRAQREERTTEGFVELFQEGIE
jgi:hypothetical protein